MLSHTDAVIAAILVTIVLFSPWVFLMNRIALDGVTPHATPLAAAATSIMMIPLVACSVLLIG